MGRSDLVNEIHVEEYRRSCMDYTKDYNEANYITQLGLAVSERYGGKKDI